MTVLDPFDGCEEYGTGLEWVQTGQESLVRGKVRAGCIIDFVFGVEARIGGEREIAAGKSGDVFNDQITVRRKCKFE